MSKAAQLGEVPLTVGEGTSDERAYRFQISFNEIANLEEYVSDQLGREVFYPEIAREAAQGSNRHIRWLVLAMLRTYHPDMTEERVGDLMMEAGLETVKAVAMQAMTPDARDVEEVSGSGAGEASNLFGGSGWDWRRLERLGRRIGLSRAEFWNLTVPEFWRELASYRVREREDYERQVMLNYMLVAIWVDTHTKQGYKMKPPRKYLTGEAIDRSHEGQMQALREWSIKLKTPLVRGES